MKDFDLMSSYEVTGHLRKKVTRFQKFKWVVCLAYVVIVLLTVYFIWSSPDHEAVPLACAFAAIITVDFSNSFDRYRLDKKILSMLVEQESSSLSH